VGLQTDLYVSQCRAETEHQAAVIINQQPQYEETRTRAQPHVSSWRAAPDEDNDDGLMALRSNVASWSYRTRSAVIMYANTQRCRTSACNRKVLLWMLWLNASACSRRIAGRKTLQYVHANITALGQEVLTKTNPIYLKITLLLN